jgi:cyanophycinase
MVIVGGAEDRNDDNLPEIEEKEGDFQRYEVLKQLLPNRRQKQILIISVDSPLPKTSVALYRKVFRKIGFNQVSFLLVKDKTEAKKEKYIRPVQQAGVVYFPGGDQLKFSITLSGSPLLDAVIDRYYSDEKFILAGTSAGAMVMSRIMIAEGGVNEALLKSDLKIYSGFGLLENSIIDSHFIKRGRFSRLAQAVITNPGQLGIGLGEDTAMVITGGYQATCWGSGTVVVIDGSRIGQSNITEAEEDCPVFVEQLIVHLLTKGCRFDLKRRKLARPAVKVASHSKATNKSRGS